MKRLLNLALFICLFTFCSVPEQRICGIRNRNIKVTMPSESVSKVSIGEEISGMMSQVWSAGDRVALVQSIGTSSENVSIYELIGNGGSPEGEFRHISGDADESSEIDVIYPVSAVYSDFAVPSLQTYLSGTYDPQAVLMSWHGDSGIPESGISLSNQTSILCLRYTGTSSQRISSVRVKVYSSESEFKEYRVSDYEGVELSSEPVSFYISVPEVSVESKVVFETILTDHSVMTISSYERIFASGKLYRFPPVEFTSDVPSSEKIAEEIYSPSYNTNSYYPIYVNRSSKVPVNTWVQEKTRILDNMIGFEQVSSPDFYNANTNKYGSRTDTGQQTATGRFYVKKVDGRFYLVDPEGCLHHHRGVASLRQGESSRNGTAFSRKYGDMSNWLSVTQEELAGLGFHGSGAFCTDTYDDIQYHNSQNPTRPITLSPSFAFLSAFRKEYSLSYCNGSSNTAICLVLDERWQEFCNNYISTELAPYLNDPNTIGFFSDNEINFTSGSEMLLTRVLDSGNTTHAAYQLAQEVMGDASTVTAELNDDFVGRLAELYYKGIKEALLEVSGDHPRLLYLGSRLHGAPKKMQGVIEAAGRWCDVISINYYSSWNVDLTSMVADWEEWAPDTPFLVTEFYTRALDNDLDNTSGAGYVVPTQLDRAYAYQHFTLGLIEARNCVGWHWFRYQDDDSDDSSDYNSNKGMFDNHYEVYPWLARYARQLNINVYNLIDYFDR